jgi:molecular chaperone DnaK
MNRPRQNQPLVGIDFGTTNSLVALVVRDEVRSLVNREDNLPHPSAVWYRGTEVVVGRKARKHLDTMRGATAQGFVRSPKMSLRREGPLHIEGRAIDPTEVVAEVLSHLKGRAATDRFDFSHAVMTIPVDFGGPQRKALRSAARKAGIGVIQFVHEPAAALYAHLRSKPNLQRALAELENRNVLVFDWGGGTLDLNLCRIMGETIYQVSTRGNNEVGGDRFDERLRNFIKEAHARQHGIEDVSADEQPGASTKLLSQCELAKIELSSKASHIVLVEDYQRADGAARNLAVAVSRAELEAVTQDLINRGLGEIDSILEQARLDRRDIELCLATGGIVNMPAVWAGLVERFGGRVPKIPHADRIIAEGAAWIAHDGLRLTLAKPIEVLVADGSGRGTHLPIVHAGISMPVEHGSIPVSNRKFFCIDPRDGTAIFEFAKPRRVGLVQPSDDRETVCVGTLNVDPEARPLLERLECEVQIDHDYVAHATLRSRGRQEMTQLEFHQLDFGLSLPPSRGDASGPESADERPSGVGRSRKESPRPRAAQHSNVTLRSNLIPTDDFSHATTADWHMVPGDLIEIWQTDFLGPRLSEFSQSQMEERNYYLPCSRCRRMLYAIRTDGPNEICKRSKCSEFRKRHAEPAQRRALP